MQASLRVHPPLTLAHSLFPIFFPRLARDLSRSPTSTSVSLSYLPFPTAFFLAMTEKLINDANKQNKTRQVNGREHGATKRWKNPKVLARVVKILSRKWRVLFARRFSIDLAIYSCPFSETKRKIRRA